VSRHAFEVARLRAARSYRESSWERNGGNDDAYRINPGETKVLADLQGPGIITHIYFTLIDPSPLDYRDGILRMYWDDETTPSVEVPFGDFFCVSNCTVRHFSSHYITVNPGIGPTNHGFNCFFPMPFAKRARIEIENQSKNIFGGLGGRLWCHIDYEKLEEPLPADIGRFHAQWRRENPTVVNDPPAKDEKRAFWGTLNTNGKDNYVLLEAEGQGHVAGIFLQVNNIQGGWYGEGDDMVFIDDDTWPPSIHGTGSEEVFGGGACPDKEYAGPYHGFLHVENKGGDTFKGLNAMYRWYVHDPVRFQKRVRHTIEHGHCNDYENDYASVAYWYQSEPHGAFPTLPPAIGRRPRFSEELLNLLDKLGEVCNLRNEISDQHYKQGVASPAWFELFNFMVVDGYIRGVQRTEMSQAALLFGEAKKTAERGGHRF
jgi:hypothetical protein